MESPRGPDSAPLTFGPEIVQEIAHGPQKSYISTQRKHHAASCSTVASSPSKREPRPDFTGWNSADAALRRYEHRESIQDMVRENSKRWQKQPKRMAAQRGV